MINRIAIWCSLCLVMVLGSVSGAQIVGPIPPPPTDEECYATYTRYLEQLGNHYNQGVIGFEELVRMLDFLEQWLSDCIAIRENGSSPCVGNTDCWHECKIAAFVDFVGGRITLEEYIWRIDSCNNRYVTNLIYTW